MKVLFVIYEIDYADHIAISYLSAVAKELGHETYLCVLKNESLVEKVKALRPNVVAYSIIIQGFDEMVAAHKDAQKVHGFHSLMGGPHATFEPDTFEYSGADAYCVGEGELPFRDFLNCIEQGLPYDKVANLITKNGKNEVRNLIDNLDELPFPDRDLTLSNTFIKDTPKKTFYTTRGCPYKCSYCAVDFYNEIYKGKGRKIRRFSVERIIREIEYVKERYRCDFVKFGDDVFAMWQDEWLEEFAEKYSARIGIPFNCYLRYDNVTTDTLKLLKKANCYSVHLSVDSTNHYVRNEILKRKAKTSVDISERLKLIRDYGINTWVNFMLAAPESTLEDDLETIRVSRKGKVTYTAYSTTVPMKGTRLYEYVEQHGLIDPSQHVSDMNGCVRPSSLSCFSEKEKRIRYNIWLLGPLAAKLPLPLYWLAMFAIKHLPENKFFHYLRRKYYKYSIENTIFKLN